MFELKRVLRSTIIALLLMGIASLIATERTEYRRLTSHNHSYGSFSGSQEEYSQFYYNDVNPIIVDSVHYQYSDGWGEGYSQTHIFNSNIQSVQEGMLYEYYVSIANPPTPAFHAFYVLDQQGRTIKTLTQKWRTQSHSYTHTEILFRNYNKAGYADSLYFIDSQGYHYYTKRNFEGSMLTSSITYKNGPVNWIPEWRFQFTYSENPVELDSYIRFDSVDNQSLEVVTYLFEQFANNKFLPSSITAQYWNTDTGSWIPASSYTYSQTLVNGQVETKRVYSYNAETQTDMIKSDLQGNIVYLSSYYEYSMEGSGWSDRYYWDSVVENDDELAPGITCSINAYPNPFQTELVINLDDKENEPVNISIYNIKGQLIRKWQNTVASQLMWDGKDSASVQVSSGIYLIKLQKGKKTSSVKVIRF